MERVRKKRSLLVSVGHPVLTVVGVQSLLLNVKSLPFTDRVGVVDRSPGVVPKTEVRPKGKVGLGTSLDSALVHRKSFCTSVSEVEVWVPGSLRSVGR